MYRAVTICLLALGCAGTVTPLVPVYYGNRQMRQAPTVSTAPAASSASAGPVAPAVPAAPVAPTAPATPVAPTAPVASSTNYAPNSNTQFSYPYSYPTYPEYSSNGRVDQTKELTAPVTTTVKNTTESSSFITNLINTYFGTAIRERARTYSNYLIQVLMVVLLGSSLLNYICTYTPYCFWEKQTVVSARSATPDYLNDISSFIFGAIDKFSNMQQG